MPEKKRAQSKDRKKEPTFVNKARKILFLAGVKKKRGDGGRRFRKQMKRNPPETKGGKKEKREINLVVANGERPKKSYKTLDEKKRRYVRNRRPRGNNRVASGIGNRGAVKPYANKVGGG